MSDIGILVEDVHRSKKPSSRLTSIVAWFSSTGVIIEQEWVGHALSADQRGNRGLAGRHLDGEHGLGRTHWEGRS